ncbi:MAG UNVERIFIED_CONTAM: hypothetical protein LVR29_01020 [Microcystis novacekii LVE1205-3]
MPSRETVAVFSRWTVSRVTGCQFFSFHGGKSSNFVGSIVLPFFCRVKSFILSFYLSLL